MEARMRRIIRWLIQTMFGASRCYWTFDVDNHAEAREKQRKWQNQEWVP
jgi:hypothetical protein